MNNFSMEAYFGECFVLVVCILHLNAKFVLEIAIFVTEYDVFFW